MPIRVHGIPEVSLYVDLLRRVPQDAKRNVRKAIVAATQDLRDDIAGRASWSSRIPGAIGVRTQFATGGVTIRVNQAKAPHARPYEGLSSNGMTIRHPVYGNRSVWVSQRARPFFFPAVDAHRAATRAAVERAVISSFPR